MTAPTSVIKRLSLVILLLSGFLAAALLIALSIGSSRESMGASLAIIFGKADANTTMETIIWHLRFPRILLAVLVGATLGRLIVKSQPLAVNRLLKLT